VIVNVASAGAVAEKRDEVAYQLGAMALWPVSKLVWTQAWKELAVDRSAILATDLFV
jgi:hypothetical protein